MAEINIQKKRMPIWPWLIGLIVVIVLVWLVVDGINRNNSQMNNNRNSAPSGRSMKVSIQRYDNLMAYPINEELIAYKA